MPRRAVMLLGLALFLGGCGGGEDWRVATGDVSGSYAEREVAPGVWHLAHRGQRWQNRETVQAFWLFRAAALTLARGHDGFSVLTEATLARADETEPGQPIQIAATTIIPLVIPLGGGGNPPAIPEVTGDIRLVQDPIPGRPPQVFNARRLHAALLPHITGPRCTGENICPHRRTYLLEP